MKISPKGITEEERASLGGIFSSLAEILKTKITQATKDIEEGQSLNRTIEIPKVETRIMSR